MSTIGQKISPILKEIEDTLWEHEAYKATKPEFTFDGFRASLKIFMAAMLDKVFELQMKEGFTKEDALNMAQKCGEDLNKFVKTYTNLDPKTFY